MQQSNPKQMKGEKKKEIEGLQQERDKGKKKEEKEQQQQQLGESREEEETGLAWCWAEPEEGSSGCLEWAHSGGMHNEFDGYGGVVRVLDGQDRDFQACGQDCGYCGRCEY